MKMHDVSLGIDQDLLVWPGNPGVQVVPNQRIALGDDANVSELRIGTHTGTHVDPPVHFIEGAGGIETVSLEALIGEAVVADARGMPGALGVDQMESLVLPVGAERVLLRTDNSELWRRPRPIDFPDSYTSLSAEAGRWVLERGIRLIGVDFLSIEQRGAEGHPTHRTLLGGGAVIVEGLDLGEVEPGEYRLVCLPLRILGGDGGPARALLIDSD